MRRVPTLRLLVVLTCWTLLFPLAPTGQAATDHFLHSEASDVLTTTSPTGSTAKYKDSPGVNRTTWQAIGIWSAAPVTSALRLEAVGDLYAWLGLKNSDDQGTYFDLRAELRKNGAVIASGETKTIQGVTRNPSNAKEVTVAFGPLSTREFNPGDILSLRLLTKVADSGGHSNAVGLRLYYDAVNRASRVGVTFGPAGPAPPTITIAAPLPGSMLAEPTVLVQGQVTGTTEVGVTVNGLVAAVNGGQFAALVAVDESVTSLTATATDVAGAADSHTIAVTVQPPVESPVVLRPTPAGGVAPLTVGFSLSSLVPIAQIALDVEGDGTVDFQGPSLEGQSFLYPAPGLYLPTVAVTDTTGATYTATAVLQVYDRTALDTMLQGKWTTMKDALRRGDTSAALQLIVSSARPRYQAAFTTLAADLPTIDSILTNLTFVRVRGQEAIYEMVRTDAGVVKSFEIRFGVDVDGLWRLRAF